MHVPIIALEQALKLLRTSKQELANMQRLISGDNSVGTADMMVDGVGIMERDMQRASNGPTGGSAGPMLQGGSAGSIPQGGSAGPMVQGSSAGSMLQGHQSQAGSQQSQTQQNKVCL